MQKRSLSFATANVLTAGTTVDCKGASVSLGLAVSGRMAKLERDFHENGIHVIGIQEGRASNDGRVTSAHCEIFTAAVEGTTKSLGCQLWVERGMAHAVSSVVAHFPRVLTAGLRQCSSDDTLHCNVVVCHTPQNQSAVEERVAFYELLGKVLRAKPCGWRSILLSDFNARVGETGTLRIGPHGAQREDSNGPSLRAFTDEHELVLLNTQWEGPHATFEARLDNIACDMRTAEQAS